MFVVRCQKVSKMSQIVMDWEDQRVPKINQLWMLAHIEHQIKHHRFYSQNFKQKWKKYIKQHIFFRLRFSINSGNLWAGFWSLLGASWGTFGSIFFGFCLELFLEEFWEASWIRFGWFWEGLGEGLFRGFCDLFEMAVNFFLSHPWCFRRILTERGLIPVHGCFS